MLGFFSEMLASATPEMVDALGETTKTFRELDRSPDRVTAIVGGAMLDQQLQNALVRRFCYSKGTQKSFFEGAANETSAKIQLAYLLQIISEEARDNLVAINTIRNRFTQRLSIRSFDHKDLAALFMDITFYRKLKERTQLTDSMAFEPIPDNAKRRDRFIATVTNLHALFILDPFQENPVPVKPRF